MIMPIIVVFAYLMDKNEYIILWRIVKFRNGCYRIQLNNICFSIS